MITPPGKCRQSKRDDVRCFCFIVL